MKVILISEECHRLIGVAKNMRSAFQFLLDDRWITEDTEFFEPNPDCDAERVILKDVMKDLKHANPIDSLLFLYMTDEDYFADQFYFREEDVIEYD